MYYAILFSWEQKTVFCGWVVKTKPIAVKYVKKYENFKETSAMWSYGLQYIGRYIILHLYKKNKNSKNKNSKS